MSEDLERGENKNNQGAPSNPDRFKTPELPKDPIHVFLTQLQDKYAHLEVSHAKHEIVGNEVKTIYPPKIQKQIDTLKEEIDNLTEYVELTQRQMPESLEGEDFDAVLERLPTETQKPIREILAAEPFDQLSYEKLITLHHKVQTLYRYNEMLSKSQEADFEMDGISNTDFYNSEKVKSTYLKPLLVEIKERIRKELDAKQKIKEAKEKMEKIAPFVKEYRELTPIGILEQKISLLEEKIQLKDLLNEADSLIDNTRSTEETERARTIRDTQYPKLELTETRLEAIDYVLNERKSSVATS